MINSHGVITPKSITWRKKTYKKLSYHEDPEPFIKQLIKTYADLNLQNCNTWKVASITDCRKISLRFEMFIKK